MKFSVLRRIIKYSGLKIKFSGRPFEGKDELFLGIGRAWEVWRGDSFMFLFYEDELIDDRIKD